MLFKHFFVSFGTISNLDNILKPLFTNAINHSLRCKSLINNNTFNCDIACTKEVYYGFKSLTIWHISIVDPPRHRSSIFGVYCPDIANDIDIFVRLSVTFVG